MRARGRSALLFAAAAAAIIAGCVPPGGGGGSTTTSTSTTTTTIAPDDPNGRYVATTGSDTTDCSVSATPCATVQYAVDSAAAGNTVYVAAGSYPELVTIADDLSFSGANAGLQAGTSPDTRGAESVVKGFRTSGNPGTVSFDITIDGFEIDPQGDTALIAATAQPLVWLRGGTTVVANNVFDGGAFVADCSFNCTSMPDYAFSVQSGSVTFADNTVTNFRRPVNINQAVGADPTIASVTGNAISGVTSRGISLSGSTGVQMPGVTVSDNTIDATGITTPSAPAGMTISNGGNVVSANTFTGLSSGVYIDICKKFLMAGTQITSNTFESNVSGINLNVNSDGGQCVSSNVEGTDGWVTGGGKLDGLTVNYNNFVGNTTAAIRDGSYNWGFWNPVNPTFTADPIDATCNWWNDANGPPTVDEHTYPDPLVAVADQLVYATGPGTQATWNYSPWLTTSAPGGDCNGTPI